MNTATKTLVLAVIILLLGVGVWWGVVAYNSNTSIATTDNNRRVTTNSTNTMGDFPADWKTYSSSSHGFSFRYPSTWEAVEPTDYGKTSGLIVSLYDSERTQGLQAKQNSNLDSYQSTEMSIYFWPNINNDLARGGQWIGMWEYTSLSDFFTDSKSPKQQISETSLGGHTASFVIVGGYGANLGIMSEKEGIYEVDFPGISKIEDLTRLHKQVLDTFIYSKL